MKATALSDAASVDPSIGPDWRYVNTLSPGSGNSPNHAYHGALVQVDTAGWVWREYEFTPPAQQYMARQLLSVWQAADTYHAASDYLDSVETLALSLGRTRSITVQDLASVPLD